MKLLRNKRNKVQDKGIDIIDDNAPFSFVEGYRSLRTSLSFMTFSGDIKVILVSSSMAGEGKSSVSINLARALSMSGKKVLLIDGDLRSPSIQRYLRIHKPIKEGFSSVLAGKANTKDAIYKFPALEIDLMLSGPIPPNASELLSRAQTGVILESLKEHYDTVIIDTPPAGIVSDAVILSQYVDGLLLVVRQKYANRDIVKQTQRLFESSKVKVLGVILNNYKDSTKSKGYKYSHYPDNQE